MKKLFVYRAKPDRLADQSVNTLNRVHGELVVGQDLGELRLAYGADRGDVGDTVLFDDVLERLHARGRALDAQVQELVGEQPAATAAAGGASQPEA